MTASKHPLDPLLPLLKPDAPAILVNAEILEVQEMAQLMELSPAGRGPR
jgi:hypothetical protein